jgi:hypothetical protein
MKLQKGQVYQSEAIHKGKGATLLHKLEERAASLGIRNRWIWTASQETAELYQRQISRVSCRGDACRNQPRHALDGEGGDQPCRHPFRERRVRLPFRHVGSARHAPTLRVPRPLYRRRLVAHQGGTETTLLEISADAKFTENELGHFLECVETGQHPLTEERSEAWPESERGVNPSSLQPAAK